MPVWGWIVLMVVAAMIVAPLKLKILKKILHKHNEVPEDIE